MNILCISHSDSGGNAYFTANAINSYTEHNAKAVRQEQSYLEYPFHLLGADEEMLIDLINAVDVLHIRDKWEWLPDVAFTKPAVVTFSGNSYRRHYAGLHKRCRSLKWLLTVSTLDLVLLNGAPWMPNPREDLTHLLHRNETFTVCHTPTFRDRKGTATIEQAVDNIGTADVDLLVVENQSYLNSVEARSKCHITIDQFRHGYGNSAIEAWAMNQPVISHAKKSPAIKELIRRRHLPLPWYDTPEHVRYIERNILRLRDDYAVYIANQENGRNWFMKYHHAPVVAQRAIKYYKMAMEMK